MILLVAFVMISDNDMVISRYLEKPKGISESTAKMFLRIKRRPGLPGIMEKCREGCSGEEISEHH